MTVAVSGQGSTASTGLCAGRGSPASAWRASTCRPCLPAEGDRVCAVNDNSPIGLATVTAAHDDQGGYGELDVDLKVWNLRLGH